MELAQIPSKVKIEGAITKKRAPDYTCLSPRSLAANQLKSNSKQWDLYAIIEKFRMEYFIQSQFNARLLS